MASVFTIYIHSEHDYVFCNIKPVIPRLIHNTDVRTRWESSATLMNKKRD